MKLYVGNLSREVTEADLREAFQVFGEVAQVTIAKDRTKTVSRGFAFVEMPSHEQATNAIAGLHMKQMKGRSLDVIEERPHGEHRKSGGSHAGRNGRGNHSGRKGRRSR
jgi:RNA recognition motif-containing protein